MTQTLTGGSFKKEVPLEFIHPYKRNGRDSIAVDPTFVANVKQHGILQPPIARPHPKKDGHYELAAGHRRLAAAKAAGLTQISLMVRSLTDQDMHAVSITENLCRQDLTPLEEANTIDQLIKLGQTPAEIGLALGYTPHWVHRRLSLLSLTPDWKKAVNKPDSRFKERLDALFLEEVARLPTATQTAILIDIEDGSAILDMTLAEFKTHTRQLTRSLAKTPFDPNDPNLTSAGSCAKCKKNTSRDPVLFEDWNLSTTEVVCLDTECWHTKLEATILQTYKRLALTHPNLPVFCSATTVSHDIALDVLIRQCKVKQFSCLHYKKVGGKTATPACDVSEKNFGKLIYLESTALATKADAITTAPKIPVAEQTPAQLRARLDNKRQRHVIQAVIDWLLAQKSSKVDLAALKLQFFSVASTLFGTNANIRHFEPELWKKLEQAVIDETKRQKIFQQCVCGVYQQLAAQFKFYGPSDQITQRYKAVQQLAEYVPLDLKPFQEAAEQKHPIPKGQTNASAKTTASAIPQKQKTVLTTNGEKAKKKAKKKTAKRESRNDTSSSPS